MAFSTADITAALGLYLWPFIRIAAMVMVAPVFSSNFLSTQTRMVITLAIAMVVVPNIPDVVPNVQPISMDGLLIVAQQVLIGACMGFMLQLLFDAFIVAGQIIAMQMGLGFASMVDPQNGILVPVISQFYLIFTTLIFVTLDGHLILIQVVSESFVTMPIAAEGLTPTDLRDIVAQGSWMFASGVLIALPAIGSIMMVNLAFGILSRAAPQISPFSIGFPLTIIMGFIIMLVTLPLVGQHMVEMTDYILQLIRVMVIQDG
ncbi:MAG TPA: flagellar biosynthetic protein FliR [Methylophaga aminisulfidivorans]|uniref:Flagellar biosynthetic protein FliR n=2 Tax=root TaxID=1 RepID=A0A7C1ZQY3_9GAMM|nr:flagellar biosynthetic protein FliR [Methylophaga sp.]HEC73525.1 flagellar biosynthetic protein FliR [Methylophaga aminisulfidivorans]